MGMMGSKGGKGLVADINVTPLVDVMLVLLIIFMVTAPMMTESGDIDLPKTIAKEFHPSEPLTISMDKNGKIKLKGIDTDSQTDLMQRLEGMGMSDEEKKKQMIYLNADKNVPYEKISSLFQDLQEHGFAQVGMVTRPTDNVADKGK